MDYTIFYPSILFHYFSLLMFVVVGGALILCADIFCIKAFLKQNAEAGTKIWFFNNKGSMIDFIGIVVFLSLTIWMTVYSRNILSDIPNVINKNYIVTKGIVTAHDSAGQDVETRGVWIRDISTGKDINLLVSYTPINKGEVYEVIYLPRTGSGAIIRKIEDFKQIE